MLTAADYKSDYKPIWCPGCGDFTVLGAITKALAMLQLPPHEVAVVSGIGCSSRIPAYTTCYGFHGVHGRALAAGTGLKVARPDLTVLVTGGDGDGYSIGGNHFMHACRRNVDLTYIVMDNHVYGMTKGQASPTTEPDWDNKLSPGGTGVRSFHPLVIALASGANFVARAFSGDPNGTADIIAQAHPPPGLLLRRDPQPLRHLPARAARMEEAMCDPSPVAPTDDPARAARRIMTDDGFNLGVLYAGDRAPYPRGRAPMRATPPTSKRSSRCERAVPQSAIASIEDFMAQAAGDGARGGRSATPSSPTRWRCTTTARSPRCSARWPATRASTPTQIMAEMGWTRTAADPLSPAAAGPASKQPETVPVDEVHYLMQPWHALQLALAAEQRAERFFGAAGRGGRATTRCATRRSSCSARSASMSSWCEAWLKKVPAARAATGRSTPTRRAITD